MRYHAKGQKVIAIIIDLSKAVNTLNLKVLKKYKFMVSVENHFILLKAI